MNHPAKYIDSLLPVFEEILNKYNAKKVLDCFAGTGKIHRLPFETVGIEIEKEWAILHNKTILGDATKMSFKDNSFDAVCTSPTYGNRMADCHTAKDKSHRNTYTHVLGKKLMNNNSGKMQWGEKYRELHHKAWEECYRVIKHNGILILNFKNHIRKGIEIDAFGWHCKTLINIGLFIRSVEQVSVNGNRFGDNYNKRLGFEYIAVFQKKQAKKDKYENEFY